MQSAGELLNTATIVTDGGLQFFWCVTDSEYFYSLFELGNMNINDGIGSIIHCLSYRKLYQDMEKSNSHPIDRQEPLTHRIIIVSLNETGLLSAFTIDHISAFLIVILSD
jgi:hypothetical protein